MNEEEMISEIEIYLSHVIAKDFPLPKAIRLMYEEYKNSNKAWEKIYDEDQNYIGELNNKIFDLKFEVKNLQKEIEELKVNNKKLQDKCKELIFEKQELTSALLDSTPNDKIKAKIEERNKWLQEYDEQEEMNELQKDDYRLIKVERNILQSLLEKE